MLKHMRETPKLEQNQQREGGRNKEPQIQADQKLSLKVTLWQRGEAGCASGAPAHCNDGHDAALLMSVGHRLSCCPFCRG